jgi:transposase
MDALSLDLRERVAAACDEGARSQSEVAEDFGVSPSFVTKLLARRRRTGRLAAKPRAGGFASAIGAGAEAALRALVAERPDATLAELRDALAARAGVRRSVPVICRALQRLGLPRKKSRRTPPSGTGPASAASGGRSGGTWAGCRPAGAWSWTSARPRRR